MNRLLYYYSLLFSGVIIVTGIITGFAFQNVAATLLFLPVSFYFVFTFAKQIYLYRNEPKSPNPSAQRPEPFKIKNFLHQKSPTYLITIGLYSLVLAVTLVRATLNFLPTPPFISPIPGTP